MKRIHFWSFHSTVAANNQVFGKKKLDTFYITQAIGIVLALSVVTIPLIAKLSQSNQKSTPQFLPVTATATLQDGQSIELEVPATDYQKGKGLRYRDQLPFNRGMLFNFSLPATVQLDTQYMQSVDLVFIANSQVIAIVEKTPACSPTSLNSTDLQKENQLAACPTYSSPAPINQVLQLAPGAAKKFNLQVGSLILIMPSYSR